jgi:hypothetical protein
MRLLSSSCINKFSHVFFPNSYHIDLDIDDIVNSVCKVFTFVTGRTPTFRLHGGSNVENLALQNIQVRLAVSYTFC